MARPKNERVITNGKTVDVKFKNPVVINGEETLTVTLRKPKIRDHLAAEKSVRNGSEFEKEIFVLATCCSCSPEDFHDMDEDEYRLIRDAYQSFF